MFGNADPSALYGFKLWEELIKAENAVRFPNYVNFIKCNQENILSCTNATPMIN